MPNQQNTSTLLNLVTRSCKTNDLWCLWFSQNRILVHIVILMGFIWFGVSLHPEYYRDIFFLPTYEMWNMHKFFFFHLYASIPKDLLFIIILYIGHFCQLHFADSLYSAFNTFVLVLFIAVVFICFCSILTFYICKKFFSVRYFSSLFLYLRKFLGDASYGVNAYFMCAHYITTICAINSFIVAHFGIL
uniref:Uncharacterized protein n=1 Tax=Rhipicephalus zambeziensis TaxID=60191 RepID=A0A224YG72_9ACAR